MTLIRALAQGAVGIRFKPPETWQVMQDGAESAQLLDPVAGVAWFLFFFPGLHLSLAADRREQLGRALGWYARPIFEVSSLGVGGRQGDTPLRTEDPTWTPMIEHEFTELRGTPALRTMHRVVYQPGNEMIMGHLLVPLEHGLFEARTLSRASTTGMRESIAVALRVQQNPDVFPPKIEQREMDDPRHDAQFPGHPLTRTRLALRWLTRDADVQVLRPATTSPTARVELPALGCALQPPPGFVPAPASSQGAANFRRVSFCGTDGVELLMITSLGRVSFPPDALPVVAEAQTRTLHVDAQVEGLALTVEPLAPIDGRPHVRVFAEGRGFQGPLRNAMVWFLDARGGLWHVLLSGTAAVPREALARELDGLARTWSLV